METGPSGGTSEACQCAEADYAVLKLHLSLAVRRWLRRSEVSWAELEQLLGVSRPGVRAIEALDSAVSIDLLTRALLALGASQRDIALEIVRYT